MSSLHFNGIWRMDWGLGNPNKTAALIAVLMVAVWAVAYVHRNGFWMALGLFFGLGICLIHTFSRGGLVSAAAGAGVLLIFAPRPWQRRRVIGVCMVLGLLVVFACMIQAPERYGQGLGEEDRSITNRFDVWKSAPAMMADAPGGWGWGNAGEAYMQWYQDPGRRETYRTLVNSHLTWMVEGGWLLRFAYVFSWLVVLMLCVPMRGNPWMSVLLAVWVTFGVAATFSSVAETLWLWLGPGAALLAALIVRMRRRSLPEAKAWAAAGGCAAVVCGMLWLFGAWSAGPAIRFSHGVVFLGSSEPDYWLVPDRKILGKYYGRTLRHSRQRANHPETSIAIVPSVLVIPEKGAGKIIVAGGGTDEEWRSLQAFAGSRRIVLLAPDRQPFATKHSEPRPSVRAVFGEFSQSRVLASWQAAGNAEIIRGAGDYLPKWSEIVFAGE
ncbi:MAG TPA: O-antigen ligase family protein [Terrimicrobiaceae bacterium]|nr:O-antigen ligase family protein [Terrimicrobiaceae bacterium]